MNKKVLIAIIIVIIIFIVGLGAVLILSNNDKDNKIKTETKVELNSETYIKSLEKISIVGTEDYLKVTENVKWEVPETEEGTTVSFAVAIPYVITVDKTDYKGVYNLNSSDNGRATDSNPKYNFSVTNLTKNGEIKILITNK